MVQSADLQVSFSPSRGAMRLGQESQERHHKEQSSNIRVASISCQNDKRFSTDRRVDDSWHDSRRSGDGTKDRRTNEYYDDRPRPDHFEYQRRDGRDERISENRRSSRRRTGRRCNNHGIKNTSALTILSTEHGRQRLILRDIDKLDLQACITYGVKTPGQLCRSTGECKWYFSYSGIVAVTDPSSQVCITSWPSHKIQRAFITPRMQEEHYRQKAVITSVPKACHTHTIVIVDQIGSMRHDASCFPSKSLATYGLLALAYVSKKLHNQVNDKEVNSVTVMEIRGCASLTVDDEPMDWILFNNLLNQDYPAQPPRSYSEYNHLAGKVAEIITQKLSRSGYTPTEELPSFNLVYMTGGDSECNSTDLEEGSSLLRRLAQELGSNKMTFTAIKFGPPGTKYNILSRMLATLRHCQVDTSVQSAHECAPWLCTRSAEAPSTTVGDNHPIGQPSLLWSVSQCRADSSRAESASISVSQEVWCWRFNLAKDQANMEWPCHEVGFSSSRAVGIRMGQAPFGKGRERLAYTFHEIDADGERVGKQLVAKISITSQPSTQHRSFHISFCRDQSVAQQFAGKFNSLVEANVDLCTIGVRLSIPQISFVDCFLYEYAIEPHGTACLLVEGHLNGNFTKWNGNNGFVRSKDRHDKRMSLANGDAYLHDSLQAFSHWSYVESSEELLICDLQGILNEEGHNPKFELTDPCICRRTTERSGSGNGCRRRTDTGMTGIQSFFRTHQCNPVCRALGLRAAKLR